MVSYDDILDDLGSVERPPRSYKEIILWWESWKRIHCNLIVGGTGLLMVAINGLFHFSSEIPSVLLMLAIPYAIMANVCYCGGWIVECLLVAVLGDIPAFRKLNQFLWGAGLAFSLLLTVGLGILAMSIGSGF